MEKKIRRLLTFLLMIALSTGNNQATNENFVVNLTVQGNACVRYPELIWSVINKNAEGMKYNPSRICSFF